MPLPMDSSPVVCQIPGCATTQRDIEAELKTFLRGFCGICKKDRGGKLCGCAFPCSLTFRAQMLNKIHELLGLEKPSTRRAIQVCFKHPDLLKQAREACMTKNDKNSDGLPSSGSFTGSFGGPNRRLSLGSSSSSGQVDSNSEEIPPVKRKRGRPKMSAFKPNEGKVMKLSFGMSPRPVGTSNLIPKEQTSQHEQDYSSSNHVLEIQNQSLPSQAVEVVSFDDDEEEIVHEGKTFVPSSKLIKLSCYGENRLKSGLRNLLNGNPHSFLNDVELVCKDGKVSTNCLILGSMSKFLEELLTQVPNVDDKKSILLPHICKKSVHLFLDCLFNGATLKLTLEDMKRIEDVANLLQIQSLLNQNLFCHDNLISISSPKISKPFEDFAERTQSNTSIETKLSRSAEQIHYSLYQPNDVLQEEVLRERSSQDLPVLSSSNHLRQFCDRISSTTTIEDVMIHVDRREGDTENLRSHEKPGEEMDGGVQDSFDSLNPQFHIRTDINDEEVEMSGFQFAT